MIFNIAMNESKKSFIFFHKRITGNLHCTTEYDLLKEEEFRVKDGVKTELLSHIPKPNSRSSAYSKKLDGNDFSRENDFLKL